MPNNETIKAGCRALSGGSPRDDKGLKPEARFFRVFRVFRCFRILLIEAFALKGRNLPIALGYRQITLLHGADFAVSTENVRIKRFSLPAAMYLNLPAKKTLSHDASLIISVKAGITFCRCRKLC